MAAIKPVLIIMSILVVAVVMLQTCVGGPAGMTTKEPTAELNNVLNSYKNASSGVATSVGKQVSSESRDQLGMTSEELGKAMLEGFSASVDSVTLNEDKSVATAIVTLSSKDLSQIDGLIMGVVAELPPQLKEAPTSEATAWIDQQVLERIAAMPVVAHNPVTVELKRAISKWSMASDSIIPALFE